MRGEAVEKRGQEVAGQPPAESAREYQPPQVEEIDTTSKPAVTAAIKASGIAAPREL